ncbi:MAG: C45 family peptidase [Sulfitobacter sp.]
MTMSLTFDAVSENRPGPKWKARWDRSWPAYRAWFTARGGDNGPDRAACEAAIERHMPELSGLHRRLTQMAGDDDRAACFLSAWCPPPYLGGCSLAAAADADSVRLVRNYDLSPDLNEGLLLRSAWTGRPVMGMVEFLWGLSDGINADGLSIALAYGGGSDTGTGFGICLILRYVLETCSTVPEAIAVLKRVPSHMAYNLVLADRAGRTASVEMHPGGGLLSRPVAVATNHQHGSRMPDRPAFTRTRERYAHLETMIKERPRPSNLAEQFLKEPLFQSNFAAGFGTLFTAEYDPDTTGMTLHWPDGQWVQDLNDFQEGQRVIHYDPDTTQSQDWVDALRPWLGGAADQLDVLSPDTDWAALGREIGTYWQNRS